MSNKAWTKGPWHIAGQGGEFVNDSYEMNICRVNSTVSWAGGKSISDGPGSHMANARLIAAAPELGEALLSAYRHVTHGGPTRAQVEDILKRAGLLTAEEDLRQ